MYQDPLVTNALRMDSMIQAKPVIAAELNQNRASNIEAYGVYKNNAVITPSTRWLPEDSRILTAKYANQDELFVEIGDGGYEYEYNEQKKLDLYYDLGECFKSNRPRSGINKILYRPGQYVDDLWNADRPRYYYADPTDRFKYWTSYRNYGAGLETGISNTAGVIENAAPFIVYKKLFPANKIVVKIQTNVGESIDGSYVQLVGADQLNDSANSSIPANWRIEYLDETDTWLTAVSNPTVKSDGYIELGYTLLPPLGYEDSFLLQGYINTVAELPNNADVGDGWVVGQTTTDRGLLKVWNGTGWVQFLPVWGFKQQLAYDDQSSTMERIVDPRGFTVSGTTVYSEFIMLRGLRIVVDTIQNPEKTFDLIEMSPRLAFMLTDYTESFSIDKVTGADDGVVPVSGLLASTGQISLFNGDGAFTRTNTLSGFTGSVVAEYLSPLTKIYFWEMIQIGREQKFLPLKVLNVESWPEATSPSTSINLQLRDQFIMFESERALDALRTNMTLTGAVAWLLDSIGFSNYIFVGFGNDGDGEINDPIIPFFFTNTDLNIAEILNQLCKATQSMMFFDEYNNFVVYSKEYVFNEQRATDFELTGTDDPALLSNIESINASTREFFNNGNIRYTDRYIQRETNVLAQAGQHDKWKEWSYKPVLLWEVSGTEQTKTRNGTVEMQSGFTLSAATLKQDLSANVPTVVNGSVVNNIIDVGDTAYWLGRYEGLFYSNGEIIQYDAIEYAVPGQNPALVWIQNNDEFQYYFARVPFRGKIFPTGRVRIYAEPFYNDDNTLRNGAVKEHGRGKFLTNVVAHSATLRSWWTNKANTQVLRIDSSFIFNEYAYHKYKYQKFEPNYAQSGTDYYLYNTTESNTYNISGTIKDMWAEWYRDENNNVVKDPGAINASALVFNGIPQQLSPEIPLRDIMQITTKPRGNANFVGSRVRLIGKQTNGLGGKVDTVNNPFQFDFMPREGSEEFLAGGSCGIGTYISRAQKTGYYLEIVSYTADSAKLINTSTENDDPPVEIKMTGTSGSTNVTIARDDLKEGYYISSALLPFGTSVVSKSGDSVVLSNPLSANATNSTAFYRKYVDGQAPAVHNVIFYKLVPGQVRVSADGVQPIDTDPALVPVKLWGGLAEILIDQGIFIGQSRSNSAGTPTVYDLGIESAWVAGKLQFSLYINGKVIAIVTDNDAGTLADPAAIVNQGSYAGMFVRGSTTAMFENFIMTTPNSITGAVSETSLVYGEPLSKPNIKKAINFQVSPFLQAAIDGVSTSAYDKYTIDYEEFGTILRECMYFNVRYNQAYPTFYSTVSPTISAYPSFHVANFNGGPYRAEFMLFNTTDKTVVLDETSGDFLRIIGITFTQANDRTINVDEYVRKKKGSYSSLTNELIASRKEYGDRSFDFDSIYIQNYDAGAALLEWLLERVKTPKREVELKTFWLPTIQLGDIVTVSYEDETGVYIDSSKQMVVTKISLSRGDNGPEMTLGAVER